jgi:hypothetical protein
MGGAYPYMDLNAKYGNFYIQRNGAAPGVIHTRQCFVLMPLKWLKKLMGVKDKYN